MNPYRVTIKVRNNRLLKAIEDAGGIPGQKWCDANGLSYSKVNGLINMTLSPLTKSGHLCADAQKLCDLLWKSPDDLWTNEQLYPLEKNFTELEMSQEEVLALLPPDQQYYLPDFSRIESEESQRVILQALDTLTNRERQIILLRFYDDLSNEEIGRILGLSGERIGQLMDTGLRKLRKPSILGTFVDLKEIDFMSEHESALRREDAVLHKKRIINYFVEALNALTVLERQIVLISFYKEISCEEAGRQIGMSAWRGRQIYEAGIRKLRKPTAFKRLAESGLTQMSEEECVRHGEIAIAGKRLMNMLTATEH